MSSFTSYYRKIFDTFGYPLASISTEPYWPNNLPALGLKSVAFPAFSVC